MDDWARSMCWSPPPSPTDLSSSSEAGAIPLIERHRGKEGRREGGKEGRREGGKEGRRDGGKEGRREGGTEGRREGGKEGIYMCERGIVRENERTREGTTHRVYKVVHIYFCSSSQY